MGHRRAGDRGGNHLRCRLLGRRYARQNERLKEAGAIVVEEVASQWLALLPFALDPMSYAAAFLLFRIFDIWKPWPAGWGDRRVHGGLGIMLDDLLAAIYAAICLSILVAVGGGFGVRS